MASIEGPEEQHGEVGQVTPHNGELTATISVAEESARQVLFAGSNRDVKCELRGIKDDVVELSGSVFVPRNCHLNLVLEPGGTSHEGTVRRVKMTGAEPTYSIWVHLKNGDTDQLREGLSWHDQTRQKPVKSADAATPRAIAGPRWARRLVADGTLTEARLEQAVSSSKAEGMPLEETLIQSGALLKETVATSLALDQSVPYIDPRSYEIHLANCGLVPEDLARRHHLFPLFHLDGLITLGMQDPSDLAAIDLVRLRAKSQVDPCLCPSALLDTLIERSYRSANSAPKVSPSKQKTRAGTDIKEDVTRTSATVRLVRSLVAESARDGASDIHIEPERDQLRVRIRVDGILHEKSVHPLEQHAPIVSRIKVEANLDIAETRKPQDGHYSLKLDDGNVDVRVSTIPTVYGENVVLRLLMSDGRTIGLEELGLPDGAMAKMNEHLANPNGMMLVTGPTGSGKTTTLYAALARLSTIERNVVTVEDPVEKRLPLLRQTQVNVKAGVTFATGLRSFLRQDPDVIMVGEIRDQETAEIAIQAALTGHLVLSTLHTNTAAGAIVRLREMGVPPFLITSSLRAVIAQRLARRICPSCSQTVEPDAKLIENLGMEDYAEVDFKAGPGCGHCMQTGYKGRIGVYEMLEITPGLSDALLTGASRDVIEREAAVATEGGLRIDGLRRVRQGLTTLEEVLRIVGVQHHSSSQAAQSTGDNQE